MKQKLSVEQEDSVPLGQIKHLPDVNIVIKFCLQNKLDRKQGKVVWNTPRTMGEQTVFSVLHIVNLRS